MSLTLQALIYKQIGRKELIKKKECKRMTNVAYTMLVSLHFLPSSKTRALFKGTDEAEA